MRAATVLTALALVVAARAQQDLTDAPEEQAPMDDCAENEVFDACASACPVRCDDPLAFCTEPCLPGCRCADGFVLASGSDRRCIPSTECKQCGANAELSSCATQCPRRCNTPAPEVCTADCRPGCVCTAGHVLLGDSCVAEADCPVVHPCACNDFTSADPLQQNALQCSVRAGALRTCAALNSVQGCDSVDQYCTTPTQNPSVVGLPVVVDFKLRTLGELEEQFVAVTGADSTNVATVFVCSCPNGTLSCPTDFDPARCSTVRQVTGAPTTSLRAAHALAATQQIVYLQLIGVNATELAAFIAAYNQAVLDARNGTGPLAGWGAENLVVLSAATVAKLFGPGSIYLAAAKRQAAAAAAEDDDDNTDWLAVGLGIGFGIFGLMLLIGAVIAFLMLRRNKSRAQEAPTKPGLQTKEAPQEPYPIIGREPKDVMEEPYPIVGRE